MRLFILKNIYFQDKADWFKQSKRFNSKRTGLG